MSLPVIDHIIVHLPKFHVNVMNLISRIAVGVDFTGSTERRMFLVHLMISICMCYCCVRTD